MQAVLEKVKHDLELAECTFKPKISSPISTVKTNPTDHHSATSPRNTTGNTTGTGTEPQVAVLPIHERLFHEDTERIKENQKKREELKKQMEIEGATFAPVIPLTSKTLASGMYLCMYVLLSLTLMYVLMYDV